MKTFSGNRDTVFQHLRDPEVEQDNQEDEDEPGGNPRDPEGLARHQGRGKGQGLYSHHYILFITYKSAQ
jgi:hypothetical protein